MPAIYLYLNFGHHPPNFRSGFYGTLWALLGAWQSQIEVNASQLTPIKQPPMVDFGPFARDGGCGDGLEMAMGLVRNGVMKRMSYSGDLDLRILNFVLVLNPY